MKYHFPSFEKLAFYIRLNKELHHIKHDFIRVSPRLYSRLRLLALYTQRKYVRVTKFKKLISPTYCSIMLIHF
jgi:hypothetical protein